MIFDLSRSIFRPCGSNCIWQSGRSDAPPSDLMLALVSAAFGRVSDNLVGKTG